MTFNTLLNSVFCANELAYFNGHQPLCDEVLSQLILRESSHHPSAIRLILPVGHPQRKRLSRYRGCYNNYRKGKESAAQCVSFRYNEEGQRIGNQSHKEVAVLPKEKEEAIFYHLMQRNFPGRQPTDSIRLIYVQPSQADRVLSRLQSMLAGT
jgi:hypothetical protein